MFARPLLTAVLLGASPLLATIPHSALAASHATGREQLSASAASIPVAALGNGARAEAAAGSAWRPVSVKGCGLAIGAFLGAVTASAANPLLIGLVGSAAFHAALYACT